MKKPLESYDFRPVDGSWVDVRGSKPVILADILQYYEILMDDRTQFARLYDYERRIVIWYRAYSVMRVTIDVWKMED